MRISANIVNSSHGETCAAASYTMNDIVRLQTKELAKRHRNNMFLSYYCKTFNSHIIPRLSPTFINKWSGGIPYMPDKYPRYLKLYYVFVERSNGKYVMKKKN